MVPSSTWWSPSPQARRLAAEAQRAPAAQPDDADGPGGIVGMLEGHLDRLGPGVQQVPAGIDEVLRAAAVPELGGEQIGQLALSGGADVDHHGARWWSARCPASPAHPPSAARAAARPAGRRV